MIKPFKPIGPPPFIDPIEGEWCRAINLEENRALDANKAKLDALRLRDKKRTEEKIDGLYDALQRKIDPDYKRPPSAADVNNIFEAAQSIIRSWNW
ncbi:MULTISPECIES: hypothetical protein [Pseudomonas]|jgi:hypothetical protein|uniref:Uncharacterized protein n=2 Tax=Pseudomonas TaxID=286 RepID=A0A2C5W9U6_PSEPU|nr:MULTISPECIES: hypothetical protein [Pseudomonas]ANI00418.1 hypothetical protein A8L59_24400 [Pseudomonas koreensis]KAB0512116.1 hypothetical protein F7R05_18090 [Pseudomonas koreensis]MBY8955755.1 hypothetical protein [Pseudomonas sp. MIS38]MCM8739707.1 hypothetical protein [Pseudomonas koreensis]MCX2543900.1 hypothetical protein [Pseudomonas sp. COW5]